MLWLGRGFGRGFREMAFARMANLVGLALSQLVTVTETCHLGEIGMNGRLERPL